VSNDTADTVVGRTPLTPLAPVDPHADTVVSEDQRKQPETRRTEARTKAPRPLSTTPVYSFRIGALKEPITLDRPARIGRRPSSPRILVGAQPRLVRVVSPQREVSATHLELRQTGSTVVVTDLRSTNGTMVLLPGSTPRKLLQGESVVVSPGTLVDIGDENILQILPLDRRPQ
jgi:pSer/pThr/pTyr-binding forkhead associated (FHA) protein